MVQITKLKIRGDSLLPLYFYGGSILHVFIQKLDFQTRKPPEITAPAHNNRQELATQMPPLHPQESQNSTTFLFGTLEG
jgi:hypothetical protein